MIILHLITSLDGGGAQSFLYNLCKFKDKRNSIVVVSLKDYGIYKDKYDLLGIPVYALNLEKIENFFSSFLKILKILHKYKPNIIHSWLYHSNIYTLILKLFTRSPIVWAVHNAYVNLSSESITTIIVYFLNSLFSRLVPSRIIYCSKRGKKEHEKILYPIKKGIFIPNGYDFKILNKRNLNNENKFKSDEKNIIFGMAARYHPVKDHLNLFMAIKIISKNNDNFRFILAGKNVDQNNKEITKILRDYKISKFVDLIGEQSDISKFYESIDCHVLTSYNESFPNVIIESMSLGIPSISTDVGDCNEIISDNGWIVPIKDPLSLARVLNNILREGRRNLFSKGKSGQNQVLNKYNINKIRKSYDAEYEKLVSLRKK